MASYLQLFLKYLELYGAERCVVKTPKRMSDGDGLQVCAFHVEPYVKGMDRCVGSLKSMKSTSKTTEDSLLWFCYRIESNGRLHT